MSTTAPLRTRARLPFAGLALTLALTTFPAVASASPSGGGALPQALPADDIRITEWMYNGAGGEFVELTNVGTEAVDVTGWSYDDDSQLPGVFDLSGFGTIEPGASVIFTEVAPDDFRGDWGLCPAAKVIGPYTNNLGRNDEINIYDAGDELVDRLTYGDQAFAGSIRTTEASGWVSAAGLGANDPHEWTLSTVGDAEDSRASTGGAFGSPGKSTRATADHDPCEGDDDTTISVDQAVVVGAIGDPTNPTALLTLDSAAFAADELLVSVTTSNESVLPAANVTIDGDGAVRSVSFAPVGRGTSSVTFTVTDPDENESSATIGYAASNQAPDPSGRYHHGISDASSALDVGDGYMLLVNDETNTLFLHQQETSGPPVKTWTFTAGELGTGSEIDFEGLARAGDRLIISGSHGNNRSGAIRTERRTLIGATITGSGATTEVAFLGRYNDLWSDLRTWDEADGHGLGADALGFVAGTASGVEPNPPAGFNIEAIELAPDDETLYLGFRAPTVDVDGTGHALVVPVQDAGGLVDGAPAVGPATFGAPVLLDLDGRSIRELRRNDHDEYLISAGPSPQNGTWALYTWDGHPAHPAHLNRELPPEDVLTGGVWESIVSVPHPLEAGAHVRMVTDSGDTNFYGTGQTKDLSPGYQKSYSQRFVLAAVPGLPEPPPPPPPPPPTPTPFPFVDVPAGSYFHGPVRWLFDRGVTKGCEPTRYCPHDLVTRGQAITLLYRLDGSSVPLGPPFADVPSNLYYSTPTRWARALDITTGVAGSNRFEPDRPTTRAELVTLLHRLAGKPKVSAASGFVDVPSTAYYASAVAWAKQEGITTGVGGSNRFEPDRPATRAEAAALLVRYATG